MANQTTVRGEAEVQDLGELAALCDTLRQDRENDRREIARLNGRLDALVRQVRFGLGVLLEGLEDPASEVVLDLGALVPA